MSLTNLGISEFQACYGEQNLTGGNNDILWNLPENTNRTRRDVCILQNLQLSREYKNK